MFFLIQHTPIVELRECVEECTGVPTHQQRLTIGSTIVEDWDHENRMMFIGDYPNIHDGSLLHLVQLEGGSRMRVKQAYGHLSLIKKGQVRYQFLTRRFYVNDIKVRLHLYFFIHESYCKKVMHDHHLRLDL